MIGVVLAGVAPAAQLLGLAEPLPAGDASWLGLTLGLFGLAATIVAQHHMGDSWRVGVDERETTALTTVGLFAVVRNPIFSGMLLAAAGLLLMTRTMLAAAAFISLLFGLEVQVRWIEEPHLARVHGARYRSYARAVGRFLPWVGRLS